MSYTTRHYHFFVINTLDTYVIYNLILFLSVHLVTNLYISTDYKTVTFKICF